MQSGCYSVDMISTFQEMLKFLCVITVVLQCLSAAIVAVQPLKIISIVSNNSDVDTPLWGRGEKLIPGALLAAQELNSNEDVLNGFHIEVVPLFVRDCSVSEGILKTVQELLSTDDPVIGVTGLFCHRLVEALSRLLNNREISLVQLSGAAITDRIKAEDQNPHFFNIVPDIEFQIDVLFDLLEVLNWRKFNLVNIRSRILLDDHYTKVVETIYKKHANHSFEILLQTEWGKSIEHLIVQLRQSPSPISVAALPPETAADLLCHAFKNKMTWPRYGWIMLDLTVNESAQCDSVSLLRAMENVIVLRTKLEQNSNSTLVSNNTYSDYVQRVNQLYTSSTGGYTHNPYSNVLYDSVWALALAVNSSFQVLQHSNLTLTTKTVFGTLNKEATQIIEENFLQITFTGVSGEFKKGQIQTLFEIYQVQNESFVEFGNQQLSNNLTLFQLELLNEIKPQDEFPQVHQFVPLALTITTSISSILCVAFVTTVLILFFCTWRQPEVVASSRILSLCLFLGSYLLLVSVIGDTSISGTFIEPGVPLCAIIVACLNIGVDLIIATVLAKTLRIVYVFDKLKVIGKVCSNYALLVMIALIVSGKIFLLFVWYASDFYHIANDHPNPELTIDDNGSPQYNVYQICYSQYATIWLAVTIGYTLLLGCLLLVLAYKTRKIKRRNYKDTKQINAFLITSGMISLVGTTLWLIFRFDEFYVASTVVANIGYLSIPIACQVFLIIPKIGPGLRRSCFQANRRAGSAKFVLKLKQKEEMDMERGLWCEK